MVVLDATIVNVALPSIQRGLHFSAASLQWVVNGYTLIFGGFLLLGGRAADLLGRKRLFVAGVALFSVASLLNGLAQSSGDADRRPRRCRASAARWSPRPRSRSSPRPSPRTSERTRRSACGARSPPAAARSACCSAASLTDLASWPWIFIVNVPVGVIALRAGDPLRPRVPGRRRAPHLRPRRRRDRHRRAGRARLRDRQGAVLRLGLGEHDRADRRRPRAAGRVRARSSAAARRR